MRLPLAITRGPLYPHHARLPPAQQERVLTFERFQIQTSFFYILIKPCAQVFRFGGGLFSGLTMSGVTPALFGMLGFTPSSNKTLKHLRMESVRQKRRLAV